jgi:hypothetical protein
MSPERARADARFVALSHYVAAPTQAPVLTCWQCNWLRLVLGGEAALAAAYDEGCPHCDARSLGADGIVTFPAGRRL